jgi:hypothetical protein
MADNGNNNTNPSNTSIYQQIAQNANYYSPSLYYSLLSQLSQSLILQPDAMGAQFIPVSDAMNNPDQSKKLFVIGLIPPSSLPTGRTLDRTPKQPTLGTAPQAQPQPASGSASTVSSSQGPAGAFGGCHGQNVDGDPGSNQGPPIVQTLSLQQLAAALNTAYTQKFGSPPSALTLATLCAHSMRETGSPSGTTVQWPNNNPGYIGNFNPSTSWGAKAIANHNTFGYVNCPGTQGEGPVSYYTSYSTAVGGATAFLNAIQGTGGQAAFQAAAAGDTQGYVNALKSAGQYSYMGVSVGGYLQGFHDPNTLVGQLGSLDTSQLPAPLTFSPAGTITTNVSTDWVATGSGASAQAASQISTSQNTDLQNSQNQVAQNYAQAQRASALASQQLITQMAQTPPLQLLVNPRSFKVNNEKVIADGNWTRFGPQDIVEHWGDNQDKIEGSGKIAAFQAIDTTTDSMGPGLTRTARQYSLSFQNLVSLYQIYRNNAGIYVPDPIDFSKSNLSVLGSIYIYFDYTLYVGSFDNFTITETDTEPYSLEYSFSFTARATFVFDQVADPNFTYGIPQGGFTVQQPPTTPTNQSTTVPNSSPVIPQPAAPVPIYNATIDEVGPGGLTLSTQT